MNQDEGRVSGPDRSGVGWFVYGASRVVSIPAFILMMTFLGFGALAREAGLNVYEAMFLAMVTWALPSAVLVVGSILGEAPFYAAAFSVMLASIRLLPMTMALVPVLKSEKTRLWQLVMVSSLVAVTAWVFAMNRLPALERRARLPFFAGFGVCLVLINTMVTGFSHRLITSLPDTLAAALLFLTPIYFLVSMAQTARVKAEYLAIGLGLVLGPVFYQINPETSLLWAGVVGGTTAYLLMRLSGQDKS